VKNSPDQYAKSIYALQQQFPQQWIKNSQIAEKLKVTPGTVSTLVQQMEKKGLLSYQSHQGCKLSKEGEKLALQTLRIHRLLEMFLSETLDYDWSEVHEEAVKLEQVVSHRFISALDKLLGEPRFDPHGDPIPNENLQIAEINLLPLTELRQSSRFVIRRILDQTSEYLEYLNDRGLVLGSEWKVTELNPAVKMITLESNTKSTDPFDVSNDIAQAILVELVQ
jgi:DtxR family Mn-dependent transcriptional regulator